MKLINLLLSLTFLFNLIFSQNTFAENLPENTFQRISTFKNFKDLATFLEFLKIKYSREEVAFLKNRFITAGFELNRPLDIKMNAKEQSLFIPQIGKTLILTSSGSLSVDGLIFNINSSLPLDQNIKNYEKLLSQKGYGKLAIEFSTAEADDDAAWKMVAGTAAVVIGLSALGLILSKFPHPVGLILGCSLALVGLGTYLYSENASTIKETNPPQISRQDFIKALDMVSRIRCTSEKHVLGKSPYSEYTVMLKDGSYILIKVDRQGTGGLMTKYSKNGGVELPLKLPEEQRKTIGMAIKSYCENKPNDAALEESIGKLKSAFSSGLEKSGADSIRTH